MEIHKNQIDTAGFTVIGDVFSNDQLSGLSDLIAGADSSRDTFRRSSDLFAIRQFLKEVPQARQHIFNDRFTAIISQLFGAKYFDVKSIYFDKPAESNWFVAYHQDLTISVDKKVEVEGFSNWTVKQGQYAVQPQLSILEDGFTVRIHLDDTNECNGALRVISGSHLKGIYRPEEIDWKKEKEVICEVPAGGVMIMKPILLHSSSRTTNGKKRRVIHIEFSSQELPGSLHWAERSQGT